MIIDRLKDYIENLKCIDTLNNAIKVNVNYLPTDIDTYSIEEIAVEPIIKSYINGDSIRQYAFIFTSREPYGEDILTNIDNSGFYEKLADEIEENNQNGILPILENGLKTLEIKVISTGYNCAVTEDTAQFKIQLRLKYFKKGKVI
ncbi:chloramphenicol resistance protein [Clostridium sporogenes]